MKFDTSVGEDVEVFFLDLPTVVSIHNLALRQGGRPGDLKINDLESALGRPQNYFYYEQERDLIKLAAVLWHGVSEAHGFEDANKRTALLSSLSFLEANGIELDPSVSGWDPGTFVETLYREKRFSVEILEHYLKTHCRWITES